MARILKIALACVLNNKKEYNMCEYCKKELCPKSLIDENLARKIPHMVDILIVEISYYNKTPLLTVFHPFGLSLAKINFCPMCGKKLTEE